MQGRLLSESISSIRSTRQQLSMLVFCSRLGLARSLRTLGVMKHHGEFRAKHELFRRGKLEGGMVNRTQERGDAGSGPNRSILGISVIDSAEPGNI